MVLCIPSKYTTFQNSNFSEQPTLGKTSVEYCWFLHSTGEKAAGLSEGDGSGKKEEASE